MATLHGILAELGIESPDMHPEREIPHEFPWVVDEEFVPIEGTSYEVAYGRIPVDGNQRHVLKKIRIDGPTPDRWFDLDEGEMLAAHLQELPVRGFRRIE